METKQVKARRGIGNRKNLTTKFDITSKYCVELLAAVTEVLGRKCKIDDRIILREGRIEYALRCDRVKKTDGQSTSFVGDPPRRLSPAENGPVDVIVQLVAVCPA